MKLCLDVDGTVFDLWPWACEAATEITGQKVTPEDWDSYKYMVDTFGRDVALQCFDVATNPDRMRERPFFEGIHKSIELLQNEGFEIVFVTYNHEPRRMASVLGPYLREQFGDVGLKVLDHHPPKVRIMERLNAFGILDDKPKTVNDAIDKGFFAATIRHPYTHEVDDRVRVFDHWSEVPQLVREHNMVRS